MASERLLDFDRKQTVILYKPFQLVSDHALTHTGRRPCKYQVADIDGEIIGDISDDLVKAVDHHIGVPLLYELLILIHAEIDILLILDILQWDPLADSSGIIPCLGLFPGQPLLLQFILNIPRGEVDTNRHGVIILAREPVLNIFAILRNTKNQLTFIVQLVRKLRIIEGSMGLQQCALWLHKYDRLLRNFII